MLEVRDIHTYYGRSYVLQGVSLKVERGSVVTITGRNGMGKTTLIRSIIGFTPPKRGDIVFKGVNITHLPPHRIAQAGIGLCPQGRRIFPSLDVKENLRIVMRAKKGGWDMERVLSLFPQLAERLHHGGSNLSGGEQQMLACARALITNPELLLLDEPSEGLSPLLIQEMGRALQKVKDTGLSILLVEQNIGLVKMLADYVYIMDKGTIAYESSPEELWHNKKIQEQYLGV